MFHINWKVILHVHLSNRRFSLRMAICESRDDSPFGGHGDIVMDSERVLCKSLKRTSPMFFTIQGHAPTPACVPPMSRAIEAFWNASPHRLNGFESESGSSGRTMRFRAFAISNVGEQWIIGTNARIPAMVSIRNFLGREGPEALKPARDSADPEFSLPRTVSLAT